MSVSLVLKQILFQSSIRSKVHRENNSDIENAINDLQSQINALATPPTGTEVTNARDNHTVLRDRLRSASALSGNRLISGGGVTEQGTPDMTAHIAAGEAIVNGVACKWAAQESGTITAPVSNTRLDYVVVNSDNSISVVAGSASATPVFPATASSQLIVAALVLKAATTSLNDGVEIFNLRNGSNSYFPNVYVYADTTLAENKQYNNLIIDSVKYDTAAYAALCQGYAHIVGVANTGANGTSETRDGTHNSNGPTDYDVYNGGGDHFIYGGGGAGVPDGPVGYKGGNGAAGKNIKIRAFSVYVHGNIVTTGGNGIAAGTTVDTWDGTDRAVAGSGGDGAAAGTVNLEAINEVVVTGNITAHGGNGAVGASVSSAPESNIGGKGGNAGSGANSTIKCLSQTGSGTISLSPGSAANGGTGTGGSQLNGNGSNGSAGSSGTSTITEYEMTAPLATDYADWIKPMLTDYTGA